jgi:carboxypeptidase T
MAISNKLLAALLTGAMVISGCAHGNTPGIAGTPQGVGSEPRLHFTYANSTDLAHVIDAGFDLHGVDADHHLAFGQATPATLTALTRMGVHVTVEQTDTRLSAQNAFEKGYRTYEQVTSQLKELALKYPDRVALHSIGKTWESTTGKADRDIWSLRITGPGDASKRPAVSFTADLHARELVTVEVAMSLIETLVSGYNQDPAIRKLVDTRVIYVAPMLNPDGHHQAEKGADWRKNTHTFPGGVGVDLNRNFPFQWGLIGASADAGSETFHGPAAASEPETQAVRDYLANIPNLKIGMDYHAFSNLVMWSWGWTDAVPPDAPLLSTIGRKLASFNHYRPEQASALYLTSGTIRDYGYGQLHVPFYTTEMGSEQDGFDPPFARSQAIWRENKPGALWLISIADNPSQVLRAGGHAALK